MKCPGQDPRFWKFDAIFEAECPKCGNQVEFFKDETKRRCKQCDHQVLNPKMDFGCAAHCKYAEHCFGELPPELIKQKQDLLKDRVAVEMKLYFHQDFKRIGHSAKVARFAEKLVEKEKGDPAVVLTAAYLHDIGAREAERKHESADAVYQEMEGPAVAREILTSLDAAEPLIDEVCDIIGHHHHPSPDETANFKIVYDADLLANLEEKQKKSNLGPQRLMELIESQFLTLSGKELAHEMFFDGETAQSGSAGGDRPTLSGIAGPSPTG